MTQIDPGLGYLHRLNETGEPSKLVAVLGCGPTGMMVAHAVHMSGFVPVIYAPKKPSRIGGAQYLHMAIPGLTRDRPDGQVTFVKVGTPDVYAKKVYGDADADTSWYHYPEGPYRIWNLQKAYQRAWDLYGADIVPRTLDHVDIEGLVNLFPRVFSTIPVTALCQRRGVHNFRQQEVWISNEARCAPDMILYSGDPGDPWYRTSRIFGEPGCEYPFDPGSKAVRVRKPLSTNCDCFPGVTRFGRYGRWEKSQLTHHAFFQARDALTEGGAGG